MFLTVLNNRTILCLNSLTLSKVIEVSNMCSRNSLAKMMSAPLNTLVVRWHKIFQDVFTNLK